MFRKNLFQMSLLLLAIVVSTNALSAQSGLAVKKAKKLTSKGFIDKKSIFSPSALDSLVKCDEYVMLISSFEGCTPCEWLRVSDVFDLYPVTPYYTDFLLNNNNETIPYTFAVSGFPTCIFFDGNGEIVAVTSGLSDTNAGIDNYYQKLDKIVKNKEPFCEHKIKGVSDDQQLPFFNYSHKANMAYLKGDMDGVYRYATKAMEIWPNLYNRYLLYKYYSSRNDTVKANEYKSLALDNASDRDEFVFKGLLKELREK